MPPDSAVVEKEKEEVPQDDIPKAAESILKAVEEKLKASPSDSPIDSKPKEDPQKVYQSWREETKKKMGWNDDQLNFHEQSLRGAQAPLLKDNALLKLKTSQKDYGPLEKAFLSEVERYEKAGRVIDSSLAEELFFMVKGKEISAGRYTPEAPSSQPKAGPPAMRDRTPSRIAPSYNPSDPGTGGSGEKPDPLSEMTEDEKKSLEFMDKAAAQIGLSVTPEDYLSMREDKKKGKREISDHAVRRMEIDPKSSGPADRDLASLWNQSAATRRR